MSSSLFAALLVLQAFNVCGDSLQLNGVVGKSILLPTEEEGLLKTDGIMEWKKNRDYVITLVRESENSPFEIKSIHSNFTGRLIMNNDTGALNISNLREEDSGKYFFSGLVSTGSLKPAAYKLQVYEMIVSVQVTTQVYNSTDSCNVTLSCSVFGSHQVALFWSTNGGNIPGTENKTTLTVSPTLAEEIYTCTAKNPVSSQSGSVTVKSCQPRGIQNQKSLYIYSLAGVGGLLLVVMVIIALVCILKRSKRGEEQADITVYAEIGEHTHAQKDSMYSQPPVPADVTTCYDVIKPTVSHQADVTTCYDVIKPTGNPAAPSTVYAVVNRPTAQQYQEVL